MAVKNVIFIMLDQLRWDCLSCSGNTIIDTPNIDSLAARGMRFTRAYAQGTSCGNSRASFYTGRHVRSHGATWNDWPLRVDEWGIADHIEPTGAKVVLMGKTHMKPDTAGIARLGIDPESELAMALGNASFLSGEHDDGLHPQGPAGRYNPKEPRYNQWLREQGFGGENPWFQWANAAEDENGRLLSGFFMEHAHRPARLPAEFTESAYMTSRAIEAIDALGDDPFFLHLSYIKPHWPYMVPAPYHAMYRDADIPAAVRSDAERDNAHPVIAGYMSNPVARCFADDAKRRHVWPAYLGLIKQVDDEIGRLLAHLKLKGLDSNTMIALSTDHGDFLGDHWLGEKDVFFDQAAKLPLIVVDPSPDADLTRGQTCDALTGAIDLLPTFVESLGGSPAWHWLEGQSLVDILHGKHSGTEREIIVAEADYARMPFFSRLDRTLDNCNMTMAYDGRYKLFHHPGLPSQLYDLQEDPQELHDLGGDPGYAAVREQLKGQLLDWSASLKNRVPVSAEMMKKKQGLSFRQGILIGFWASEDVPAERKIPEHLGFA
ncbi:MAG: sulfatase-like hydrolase/transferase [Burkholderiaceae bacterium]